MIEVAFKRRFWEYGRIIDGELIRTDETTRPLQRAKVLAAR